jgi:hypothetical protein
MWVDGFRDIVNFASHFDRQYRFSDQLTCTAADDTASEYSICFGIDKPLRQTVGDTQSLSPTTRGPGIDFDVDSPSISFGFILCQSSPSNLWIGENDGRDRRFVEGRRFTGKDFRRNSPFVRRFVREHGIARDVADRQNVWISGSLLAITINKATFVDFNFGIF